MRDLLKQALLIAITKGASIPFQALGQVAKAGQYTSPTGASTMFSPAERVASNPNMSAAQLISQQAPPGATFTPTRFGLGRIPDYAQEASRLAVQKAPLERQALQSTIDWQKQLPGLYKDIYKTGQTSQSIYQVGDILERNGKRAKITGFDEDGTPFVEPL